MNVLLTSLQNVTVLFQMFALLRTEKATTGEGGWLIILWSDCTCSRSFGDTGMVMFHDQRHRYSHVDGHGRGNRQDHHNETVKIITMKRSRSSQ
jgi:hypothetical protein